MQLNKHLRTPEVDGRTVAASSELAKEERTMKWGGYNRKGEERMGKVIRRLLGTKGTYYLLTVAALALLLAESIKWSPETPGK